MATSRMVGQIGRVVGGRYRLLAPIGTGASADVYVADDVVLRRRVAVKVLHAALASDEGFLRRFRAEARTVAALRHPNIVGVFDWGEEQDGPYLVLEYLGGGSLRDLLDRGDRLTVSQALLVGLEAARGLDYAHRRGLVHRDVKPANFLFDDEGRLAIADFGIARALAEATWTEPSGAVVGTVRYASPEQARGNSIDGKADVYALALLLVEAVTGQVPFAADTTIATLMARLDGPIQMPDVLGPLGEALALAGALDPADRVDAAGLVVALDAAARQLPRPAPLSLAAADPIDLAAAPPDQTLLQPGNAAPGVFDAMADPTLVHDSRAGLAIDATTIFAPVGANAPYLAGAEPPGVARAGRQRRRRWPRFLAVALAALMVAGVAAYAVRRAVTPTYPIPAITASMLPTLDRTPWPHHFRVTVRHMRQDNTVAGQLLGQNPPPNAKRPDGTVITVTVSDGPTLVAIPDLSTQDQAGATASLKFAAMVPTFADPVYSDTVKSGLVISWSPQGLQPKGTTVTVTLSKGPKPIAFPNLQGRTYDDAKAILDGLGLPSTKAMVYDDTVPPGSVVGTTPPAGSVLPGTTITINVSQGPQTVIVPDVRGMTVEAASAQLAAVGLKVGTVYGSTHAKHVVLTDPAPGTQVKHGSPVDLYILQ